MVWVRRKAMTRRLYRGAATILVMLAVTQRPVRGQAARPAINDFNDVHFHLTNYIQEGTDIRDFLRIMGKRASRVALFGIPLQQTWSFENSGNFAPTYYLQTDAPLYYYSFTDAFIAMAYRALPKEQQARFDPMITGFNPADMYAVDHIRREISALSVCLPCASRACSSSGSESKWSSIARFEAPVMNTSRVAPADNASSTAY